MLRRYSPADLLMVRKIKTILLTAPGNRKPKLANFAKVQQCENHVRHQTKQNYDLRKRANTHKPLEKGDRVHAKNLQTDGQIVRNALYPRSYIEDTPRGTVRRNRRHLVKLH